MAKERKPGAAKKGDLVVYEAKEKLSFATAALAKQHAGDAARSTYRVGVVTKTDRAGNVLAMDGVPTKHRPYLGTAHIIPKDKLTDVAGAAKSLHDNSHTYSSLTDVRLALKPFRAEPATTTKTSGSLPSRESFDAVRAAHAKLQGAPDRVAEFLGTSNAHGVSIDEIRAAVEEMRAQARITDRDRPFDRRDRAELAESLAYLRGEINADRRFRQSQGDMFAQPTTKIETPAEKRAEMAKADPTLAERLADPRYTPGVGMKQEAYWMHKAPATPTVADLPAGAFKGSQNEFESLSPGMRREIARAAEKAAKARQDRIGRTWTDGNGVTHTWTAESEAAHQEWAARAERTGELMRKGMPIDKAAEKAAQEASARSVIEQRVKDAYDAHMAAARNTTLGPRERADAIAKTREALQEAKGYRDHGIRAGFVKAKQYADAGVFGPGKSAEQSIAAMKAIKAPAKGADATPRGKESAEAEAARQAKFPPVKLNLPPVVDQHLAAIKAAKSDGEMRAAAQAAVQNLQHKELNQLKAHLSMRADDFVYEAGKKAKPASPPSSGLTGGSKETAGDLKQSSGLKGTQNPNNLSAINQNRASMKKAAPRGMDGLTRAERSGKAAPIVASAGEGASALEKFRSAYEATLAAQVKANPGKYAYGPDRVPEMARKMTEALAVGGGDTQSPTVKAVAKSLGIKPTVGAIKAALNDQPAPAPRPQKSAIEKAEQAHSKAEAERARAWKQLQSGVIQSPQYVEISKKAEAAKKAVEGVRAAGAKVMEKVKATKPGAVSPETIKAYSDKLAAALGNSTQHGALLKEIKATFNAQSLKALAKEHLGASVQSGKKALSKIESRQMAIETMQAKSASRMGRSAAGILAPVAIGAAMLSAANDAKAQGTSQTAAAAKEGAAGAGGMAVFMGGTAAATAGLVKAGMAAARAVPVVQGALMAGGALKGAWDARKSGAGAMAAGAARGAWDMSLPGMVVNTGIAAKDAVQGRMAVTAPSTSAPASFQAASDRFQAMRAAAATSDPGEKKKGWSNAARIGAYKARMAKSGGSPTNLPYGGALTPPAPLKG